MWVVPKIEKRLVEGRISEAEKFIEIKRRMNRNLVGEIG
jgi:hypothetical protein